MRSTVAASPAFHASVSVDDVGLLAVEILERFGQHAVLLVHRHLVEERDLKVDRFEALHALAVDLARDRRSVDRARAGVEAGLLPFELRRASAPASTA